MKRLLALLAIALLSAPAFADVLTTTVDTTFDASPLRWIITAKTRITGDSTLVMQDSTLVWQKGAEIATVTERIYIGLADTTVNDTVRYVSRGIYYVDRELSARGLAGTIETIGASDTYSGNSPEAIGYTFVAQIDSVQARAVAAVADSVNILPAPGPPVVVREVISP